METSKTLFLLLSLKITFSLHSVPKNIIAVLLLGNSGIIQKRQIKENFACSFFFIFMK